ncbi:hypothetical protein Taro_035370 [Colocasia esculenta]|uniref:Uncharacterized protein n=1 Tax=Colocasia esculenta TaxID=4460 RepID=A0A843WIG2_COLES|nr:hypothetical protein [Colocasia esculenta]
MVDDDGKDLERVALIDVFSEDDVLVSYPAGSSPLDEFVVPLYHCSLVKLCCAGSFGDVPRALILLLIGRFSRWKLLVTSENRRKKSSPRATRAASRLPVEPSRRPPSSRSVQPKTREEVLLASSHVGKSHFLNVKEKLISGDLNNATPRVTTSIKVSNSSVKPHASASCNSNSRSGGTSSDRMGKARPEDLRKKTSRKVDPPSSMSVNVCPVRDSKGNCGVRNAKSTMRLFSSISPSSSVDSLASASSSSSTSTVKNPTNSPTTLEPSSYGTLHDSGRVPKGELVNSGSSGIYLWSNLSTVDAARYHISGSEAKEFKPSGLRLPSPKIGYFDAVTEVSMTPKTSLKDDAGRLNKGLVVGTKEEESGGIVFIAYSSSDLKPTVEPFGSDVGQYC